MLQRTVVVSPDPFNFLTKVEIRGNLIGSASATPPPPPMGLIPINGVGRHTARNSETAQHSTAERVHIRRSVFDSDSLHAASKC